MFCVILCIVINEFYYSYLEVEVGEWWVFDWYGCYYFRINRNDNIF